MCVWYLVELAFGLTLWAEKDRRTLKGIPHSPIPNQNTWQFRVPN